MIGGPDLCLHTALSAAPCSFDGVSSSAVVPTGLGGSVSAIVASTSGFYAAGSSVAYSVELIGPPGVSVPIAINGSAGASDSGGITFGTDLYTLTSPFGFPIVGSVVAIYFSTSRGCSLMTGRPSYVPCETVGAFSLTASVTSDLVYLVAFSANAVGPGTSASLDPTITIDPAFPQASEFSVIANPGVFNTPSGAVSEPDSLTGVGVILLIAGFGCRRVTSQGPDIWQAGNSLRSNLTKLVEKVPSL